MSDQMWVIPTPEEPPGHSLELLGVLGIGIETTGVVLQQVGQACRVLAHEFYQAAIYRRQVRAHEIERAVMAAELDHLVNGDPS